MNHDNEIREKKIKDIEQSLNEALVACGVEEEISKKISISLTKSSISVSAPEHPEVLMEYVRLSNHGRGGGKSIKPGNVTLDIGKLMQFIADGVTTVIGVYHMPIVAPLAFIKLYRSLKGCLEVQLSETEAVVIYTLWMYKDHKKTCENSGLLDRCNAHLIKYGRQNITQKDLDYSLSNLEKIGCIKKSSTKSDAWFLPEWVRVNYR